MDFITIEDAIVAALGSAMPYLRTLGTYAGELGAGAQGQAVRHPAAFLRYDGTEFESLDGTDVVHRTGFTVIVMARSLRGAEDARKSTDGAYAMVADVLGALANKDLGLATGPLRPKGVKLLKAEPTSAAYGVSFSTSYESTYE